MRRCERVARWIDLPLFLGFGTFVAYHWTWHARYLIGVAVAAIGFALWALARAQLGKSFSIRAEETV
jgi:aminopeptidase N